MPQRALWPTIKVNPYGKPVAENTTTLSEHKKVSRDPRHAKLPSSASAMLSAGHWLSQRVERVIAAVKRYALSTSETGVRKK